MAWKTRVVYAPSGKESATLCELSATVASQFALDFVFVMVTVPPTFVYTLH